MAGIPFLNFGCFLEIIGQTIIGGATIDDYAEMELNVALSRTRQTNLFSKRMETNESVCFLSDLCLTKPYKMH